MKKNFTNALCLGLLLSGFGTASFAQTLFMEDFQAVTTSGNYGDLPAGWTEHNVDARTPNSSVNFMGTHAWRVRNVSGEKFAISTSWYTPAGASNDWMVTPQISVPASGTPYLLYDVYAPDANFPDGYQVYVSTTGTAVADFGPTPVYSETAAPSTGFVTRAVNLSAYLGQDIYIAFRNNSNDMFLLYMDNIEVRMLPANEVKLNSITVNRYSAVSTNNTLALNVTNFGSNNITSLEVEWTDGVTPHVQTITGLNITPGASANVNHPTAVNFASAVEKNISVNILQVNATTDSTVDNSGSVLFNTVSSIETKNVLVEEGTGTWCGWCPRGAVAMAYMTSTYPERFIGIAVHNGDPMTVSAYDAAANFSGYPGCNVDRTLLDQPVAQANFQQYYNSRKDLIVPAGMDMTNTYNTATREVSVTVNADFVTPFSSADFRLAVVVVEDSVTGTASGYNQTNYYAGGANGAMGGYESLPGTVPAAQMVYDHVGRALLGGYNGQAGSVPTTLTDGSVASYTFTYTLPAGYDEKHIKLVGLLIDQTNGNVVNAKEMHLSVPMGVEESLSSVNLKLYPNPATEVANLEVQLESTEDVTLSVYDLGGRMMHTQYYGNLSGTQILNIPVQQLSKGEYIVTVSTSGRSYSRHMIVQ